MDRAHSNLGIKEKMPENSENNDPNNPRTADLSALRIHRPKEEKIRSYKWLRIIPWLLIPAALVAAYFLLLDYLRPGTEVEVTNVRVIKGASAKATLSASGYVVAQRSSAVASKATGRVTYLAVGEGDRIRNGQLIARVESEDIEAALEMSRANLEVALADSLDAEAQYSRNQKIHQTGGITDEQLQSFEAAYKRALANVKARRAAVKSAEIELENTYIRAPFDGTVITKIAEIGDIVAPFASSASSRGAVVTLADMSSLEVEADVSEANIQKVKVGQPCEIVLDAYPEIRYAGTVKNIVPTASRASATIMTRIGFDKIDSLIFPEMSARVYFLSPEKEALQVEEPSFVGVSQNAVIEEEDSSFVFLVIDDHVEKRAVEVGRTVGKIVEIKGGLEVNDEVVLTPPRKLKHGDKIKISKR